MSILLALLLLAVSATCSFGPGFFLLRRMRWNTDERLCASIVLSLILTYLVATGIYLLRLPWNVCWIWTCLSAVGLFASRYELRRILKKSHVRNQIAAFSLLLLLGTLLLSVIRNYSGGQWYADWFQHFQRVEFFLKYQPNPAPLFGGDVIPSRPPLMNILTAFFLAHARGTFDFFQISFMFLNLLVFFACVLLAGLLIRFGSRNVWLIAAMVALNPMVLQNSTFTWTKLFAAFFVLVCLALYLRAFRLNDPRRMIGACICMAAATLVHYSALPYAVPLAIHYLFILRGRSHKMMEIGGGGGAAIALLFTWFGWSTAVYGWNGTFYTNTSVVDSEKLNLIQNVEKIGQNFIGTFIPHPLHASGSEFRFEFEQPSRFGWARDYFFHLYQTNLPLTWGSFGWIGVAWLAIRLLRRARPSERRFWIWTLGGSIFLGIATHGTFDPYGLSQICLQAITLLGLTLLAGGFRLLPAWFRFLLVLSFAVDTTVGILLQFRVQTHAMSLLTTPGFPVMDLNATTLNILAVMNAQLQAQANIALWSSHFELINSALQILAATLLAAALLIIASADRDKPLKTVALGTLTLILFAAGAMICALDDTVSSSLARSIPSSNPSNNNLVDARYAIGVANYQLGQFNQAQQALTDAFLLDPQNPRNRYALRLLLLPNGRRLTSTDARAAEDFLHFPDNPTMLLRLSQALHARGYSQAASERLEEALRLNPLIADGLNQLRRLLAEQGQNPAEIEMKIEQLNPSR